MKDTAQAALMVGLKAIWDGDPANFPEGVAIVDTSAGAKIIFTYVDDDKVKAKQLRENFRQRRGLNKALRHAENYSTGKLPQGISRIKKDDQQ